MNKPLPRSVQEYLEQLREQLAGADPALIQDALYDAEEYLRGEMHQHPDKSEEQVLAAIASTYGAPAEVAEAYRETELKVQAALRTPRPRKRQSLPGRFFGVLADARTYTALFYMLLALFTGIFYFTWVVAGTALSFGLFPLIIGIPFFLLFLGSVRLLSLVEGRIVETFLGVRMPRRPPYTGGSLPLFTRIKELLVDGRTWSTLFYMVLQLPLGILYFTIVISWLAVSMVLILSPISHFWSDFIYINGPVVIAWLYEPLLITAGILLLIALMHFAHGIAKLHGHMAKALLVRVAD